MYIPNGIIFLSLLLFSCQSNSQSRIRVHVPTAEEETAYVWQTLQDTRFFEENNYTVSLPHGKLIEELKEEARSGTLDQSNFERLQQFMGDSVYRVSDYDAGLHKIEQELTVINEMVNAIDTSGYQWSFKLVEEYQVNLTLYGPGGSYNPDEGSILIFTTPIGEFKGYQKPKNTIIHEIVHIGIEASIINRYQVPHRLKERIVDTFVSLHFGERLPNYQVQDMGETRSDQYLQSTDDFRELNTIVETILATPPADR